MGWINSVSCSRMTIENLKMAATIYINLKRELKEKSALEESLKWETWAQKYPEFEEESLMRFEETDVATTLSERNSSAATNLLLKVTSMLQSHEDFLESSYRKNTDSLLIEAANSLFSGMV